MLIGLSGRAGAGKDTSYLFIKEWADENHLFCRRDAFADRLKWSAARALGFEGDKEEAIAFCNYLKEAGYIDIYGDERTGVPYGIHNRITGRQFLQLYGTEAHRDVFGHSFWVDAVLNNCNPDELLVITDVRFNNEAEAIRDLGGEVWHVHRPGSGISESTHASEQALPDALIDRHIYNLYDLTDLRQAVKNTVQESLGARV